MSDSYNPYQSGYAEPTIPPVVVGSDVATRLDRFLAALIDVVILLLVNYLLQQIANALIGSVFGLGLFAILLSMAASVFIGLFSFFAVNGYLLVTSSQTIGKMVLKMKIVKEDGSLISFPELVLKRYLPWFLIAYIPIIGFILVIVDCL